MTTKNSTQRQILSPIRIAARQSGLSTDVIRAWEKRYGVVKPKRGANGRRLYSAAHITRLRLLNKVTQSGYRIGDVAKRSSAQLNRLANDITASLVVSDSDRQIRPNTDAVMEYFDQCLKPLEKLDMRDLHEILKLATHKLSPSFFLEDLLSALIHHVREECYRGALSNEHMQMFRALISSYLLLLNSEEEGKTAPFKKTVTCSIKRDTELYSLRASAAINVHGMHSIYLGDETSAEAVIEVFRTSAADIVVLCSDGANESVRVPNTIRNICHKLKKNKLILQQPAASTYKQVALELDLPVSHDFADLIQTLQVAFAEKT